MPGTRYSQVQIVSPVLTSIARSYRSHGFIADQLLPTIPTSVLSGQYPIFTKSFWFQNDVDNESNDRAPAKEVDYEWSLDAFMAKEYALKVSITQLERMQADPSLRLERSKTEFLTQRMDIANEVRVKNVLSLIGDTTTGGITAANTHIPVNLWDTSTGDPEKDFKQGVIAIYRLTGLVPNVAVIPFEVAYALAVNTNFRQLLRYDAAGQPRDFIQVGERVIPSVIHGMQVIIPQGAQLDTSKEGGTSAIVEIWGKDVRLMFVDPSAQWGIPSLAYRITHTPRTVTRWSQTDPDVDYIRELERYDVKVVAPDTGYIIKGTIS